MGVDPSTAWTQGADINQQAMSPINIIILILKWFNFLV